MTRFPQVFHRLSIFSQFRNCNRYIYLQSRKQNRSVYGCSWCRSVASCRYRPCHSWLTSSLDACSYLIDIAWVRIRYPIFGLTPTPADDPLGVWEGLHGYLTTLPHPSLPKRTCQFLPPSEHNSTPSYPTPPCFWLSTPPRTDQIGGSQVRNIRVSTGYSLDFGCRFQVL